MTSIVLHAGGPKTGSGSVQRAFNPQKPQISQTLLEELEFQFLFAKAGISANLGGLVGDLSAGRMSTQEMLGWKQHLSSQLSRFNKLDSRAYIFSAEFSGAPRLTHERSARVAYFLDALGTIRQVIYYARPLMSLPLSLGLQKAKSGNSHNLYHIPRIRPSHIVDKYLMYSSHYEKAEISFCCFDRNLLLGNEVRIDFASRLSSSGKCPPNLEAEINLIPSSNEKIDLPILKLITKLYQEAGFGPDSKVPALFINFLTMGRWTGAPCTLLDLYSPEEIEGMYQNSILEISTLRNFTVNSSLSGIADFFQESLKSKDYYMVRHTVHSSDLSAYQFRMTDAQRNIIGGICSKMRKMSLTKLKEFKTLSSIANDTIDACYCAEEILPIVLNAAMCIA